MNVNLQAQPYVNQPKISKNTSHHFHVSWPSCRQSKELSYCPRSSFGPVSQWWPRDRSDYLARCCPSRPNLRGSPKIPWSLAPRNLGPLKKMVCDIHGEWKQAAELKWRNYFKPKNQSLRRMILYLSTRSHFAHPLIAKENKLPTGKPWKDSPSRNHKNWSDTSQGHPNSITIIWKSIRPWLQKVYWFHM